MGGGGGGLVEPLHFNAQREPIASAAVIYRSRLFAPLKKPLRNLAGLPAIGNPPRSLQIHAAIDTSAEGTKWWQKSKQPNMHHINSTQEFLHALSNAGEKLVVVEFFATWCGSCRALYPKLCQLASDHPDVDFLQVDYDANKPMCKSLSVKFLPFFHFYRGANGRLDSFSCSLSKLARLKEAIEIHNTDRCSLGPPIGLGDDVTLLGITTEQLSTGSAV